MKKINVTIVSITLISIVEIIFTHQSPYAPLLFMFYGVYRLIIHTLN